MTSYDDQKLFEEKLFKKKPKAKYKNLNLYYLHFVLTHLYIA